MLSTTGICIYKLTRDEFASLLGKEPSWNDNKRDIVDKQGLMCTISYLRQVAASIPLGT